MINRISIILKCIWGTLSILVLLITINGINESDVDIFFVYGMLFLSFPSGLIPYLICIFTEQFLINNVNYASSNLISVSVVWFFITVFGYYQWFVLIPLLWKKIITKYKK